MYLLIYIASLKGGQHNFVSGSSLNYYLRLIINSLNCTLGVVIIKITWTTDHLTDQNKQIKSAKQSREFFVAFRTDQNSQRQRIMEKLSSQVIPGLTVFVTIS